MLTLLAMLALAGLTLATLFLRAQIEAQPFVPLTQANVASSTITAAVRFGGYDVIAIRCGRFDTGPDTIRLPCLTADGKLVAPGGCPGESIFPSTLVEVSRLGQRRD